MPRYFIILEVDENALETLLGDPEWNNLIRHVYNRDGTPTPQVVLDALRDDYNATLEPEAPVEQPCKTLILAKLQEEDYTIKDLASEIGRSYMTTYMAAKKLLESGQITRTKDDKLHLSGVV